MANHHNLFIENIPKLKQCGGGSQYIGLCRFHNDTTSSFSLNMESGVWNCKACGERGNAYHFAEKLGLSQPHQYIESNGADYSPIPPPPKNPPISKEELTSQMEGYKNNLKGSDKYPEYWEESLIDELGIGLNGDDFVFAYYDSEGELKGYKVHKKWTKGEASNHWYPLHKISDYKTDIPLIIVEGEKDVITAISQGKQAISTTAGAMSIPSYDSDLLSSFKEVYICYDNDKSGEQGAKPLADKLILNQSSQDVYIAKWDKGLPKKFDITDSYEKDGGLDFLNALTEATKVEKSKRIGGIKLIRGNEATTMTIKPRKQIIEQILPENAQVILGGTTGANKSFMAMDMGMSIANNENEFLGFKINLKGLKVLFFDTEIGEDSLIQRFQEIKARNYKDWNADSRFDLASRVGNSVDIYDDLEEIIKMCNPDVVFIDCLYNTTDGKDISKNHNIQPITQRISEIRDKYKCTVVAVHHSNKGGHEQGLVIDRLAGGSALQNWAEHIMLLSRTNEDDTRLFRIGKSRHFDYSQAHYLLRWDSDKLSLNNYGITNDWKPLLIQDSKKIKWAKALDEMKDEFTTGEFKMAVLQGGDASERTAFNWLKEMEKCGVIVKLGQGEYKKKLGVFEDVE